MITDELNRLMGECEGRIIVGYSGGMDSHVLLHYLKNHLDKSPHALHINHGLSNDAEMWQSHCREVCSNLEVDLSVIKVAVSNRGSIEAAARTARYHAFENFLQEDDLLILAHHQDDQTETVLLHLLRGDSPFGLLGMPQRRAMGRANLLRPMLQMAKVDIESYARTHSLVWIEDESNRDTRMDRNYLRHQVLPLLKVRWPGLQGKLDASFRRSKEVMEVIDSIAANDFSRLIVKSHRIDLAQLRELPRLRQRNLLRVWFRQHDIVEIPPVRFLDAGLDSLLNGKKGSAPLLNWQNLQLRRYGGFLYLLPVMQNKSRGARYVFMDKSGRPVAGKPVATVVMANGVVTAESTLGHGLCVADFGKLSVRLRQGGEKIRFSKNRSLKNVLQENNIPAFLRDFIPLIYNNEELVAIGAVPDWNLPFIVSPGVEVEASGSGWQFNWHF